jgi:hypothetical protein
LQLLWGFLSCWLSFFLVFFRFSLSRFFFQISYWRSALKTFYLCFVSNSGFFKSVSWNVPLVSDQWVAFQFCRFTGFVLSTSLAIKTLSVLEWAVGRKLSVFLGAP